MSIAEEMDAVIINADALQLYKRIPILTAQPSEEDKEAVPHQLYGVLTPEQSCSVGIWVEMAREAIDCAHKQGKTPIVVGGTGLYLKGLMEGLPSIPEIDPLTRKEARVLMDSLGHEAFHKELASRDPVIAGRLHPSDTQRLLRAYEVVLQTGIPLSDWQQQEPVRAYLPEQFESSVILPERTQLYAQCDQRFHQMIGQGALKEVRALSDVPDSAPVWRALGAKELRDHLQGKMTLDEAIILAQASTRHYAKRQMTWFRHQLKGAKIVDIATRYSLQ